MRRRADADDRRVEVPEAVLGDVRGDLGAEAAELAPPRARRRRAPSSRPTRRSRPMSSGTSVRGSSTSTLDPLRLELARRAQRLRHQRAERDHRHVGALAHDARACRARSRTAPRAPGAGSSKKSSFCSRKIDRVVVLDRRREQALRVERVRRHHDDEPRDVREQRLEALRVLRAEADAAAADHADHERQRRRAAHHEAQLRGLVHDLVEGDAGEVGELQLDDRAAAP